MTAELSLESWIDRYAEAWVTADPAGVLPLFTADATYRSHPFSDPDVGHAGIAAYWDRVTASQDDVELRWGTPLRSGDFAAVEWWATMLNDGADVTLAGILLLHFAPNGVCRALREYWHVHPARLTPPPGWGMLDLTGGDGAAEAAQSYVEGYPAAWAAGDVEGVVSLYSPDVVYRSTPFRPPQHGHEGVRAYTEETYATEKTERLWFSVVAVEGSSAVYEWWATLTESGTPTTLAGGDIILIAPDGACRELREHWHEEEGTRDPFPGWGS